MLLHKLSLRWGMPVPEIQASMTTGQLASWFAFDKISPIGDERMDYLMAFLCMLMCQVAGAKPKSGGVPTIEDFLLFKKPPVPMTDKELFMSMFSGRIVKKGTTH